jgi:hypothetical protein
MSTRGAHSWVRSTPTGLPDWTSRVSSDSRSCRVRTIASKAPQLRAARPEPPYTMSWSGCSATSGSRLFISIRMAASCGHPLQDRVLPRGARTGRGPGGPAGPGAGPDGFAAVIAGSLSVCGR